MSQSCMNHFPSPLPCGCSLLSCPPREQPSRGVLLPHVLSCGRHWERRVCVPMQIGDLPPDFSGEVTLTDVSVCGAAQWRFSPPMTGCSCRLCQQRQASCGVMVTIPVRCRMCSGCGEAVEGQSLLQVDVPLRMRGAPGDCWRQQVMVLPCVRLVDGGAPVCVRNGRLPPVEGVLEVLVEVFVVRWEGEVVS